MLSGKKVFPGGVKLGTKTRGPPIIELRKGGLEGGGGRSPEPIRELRNGSKRKGDQ